MKQILLSFSLLLFLSISFNTSVIAQDEVFMVVEQMPRFPGCEDIEGTKKEKEACAQKKMLEYIYRSLKYPKEARDQGIEGQVVIQFVVNKDGSISDSSILRDLKGGCGEESLRVVKEMNSLSERWTPGMQRGQAVNVKYTLPVKFKLAEKKVDDGPFSPRKVYTSEELTEQPMFPGCESKTENERKGCADMEMLRYIYGNLKYPATARENGIQGTAIISATITNQGRIIDFKIDKDPGGGTGQEALRVLKSLEKMDKRFVPGKLDGKAVYSRYVIPVKFKLE